MTDEPLLAALASIQARGAIGPVSLTDAVRHADQFVAAIPPGARRLVDLGSGGGLPGLVIAERCPHLAVTLVERRATRADLLRRAVSGLGLSERVAVVAADVRTVVASQANSFDVVTARSFGPPAETLRWAAALLVPGGRLIVSEPPEDIADRWPIALLDRFAMTDLGRDQGVRRFQRR